MGNCMGQRRVGRGGSQKGLAPKTPSKDKEEQASASVKQTTGDKAQERQAENSAKTVASKEDENLNHAENRAEVKEQEKVEHSKADPGENDDGKDVLTTSWVVFDDDETSSSKNTGGKSTEAVAQNLVSEAKVSEKNELQTTQDGKKKVAKEERKIETGNIALPVSNTQNETSKESKGQEGSGIIIKSEEKDGSTSSKETRIAKAKKIKDEEVNDSKKVVEGEKATDVKIVAVSKAESESTKILHEVRNGRVVAAEQTKIIRKDKGEAAEERNTKVTGEKRLDILRTKMINFARSQNAEANVIDIQRNLFTDKLFNEVVLLEEIQICGREINGLVAIAGDGKASKVVIRFSTDSWKSQAEEEAIPFKSLKGANDDMFQRFFFSFFVPFAKSVHFAVECIKESGVYWDSNNSMNYFVENVKENNDPGKLVARFCASRESLFADFLKVKSVCLQNAAIRDGNVHITIGTRDRGGDPPGVRYTINNWESFADIASSRAKGLEEIGEKIFQSFNVNFAVSTGAKLMFVVFWKHDGMEEWDNNEGKNYEIDAKL